MVVGLILCFQNCSPSFLAVSGSADLSSAALELEGESVVTEADLAWSTKLSAPTFSRLERVERWGDVSGQNLNLYPPLRPNTTLLDLDKSPKQLAVGESTFLRFESGGYLTPAVADLSAFVSDQYTVYVVVRDLKMEPNQNLRLFHLIPENGDVAGYIGIDLQVDDAAKGTWVLWAYHWFDGTNYGERRISVPAELLSGRNLAIGVRFDRSPERMQIAINGELSKIDGKIVGSPSNLGLVARRLSVKGFNYGGEFSLAEIAVYNSAVDDASLARGTYALAARWDETGTKPTGPDREEGKLTFADIQPLFSKVVPGQNGTCIGCHSSDLATRAALLLKKNASGASWVVPGAPAESQLFKSVAHRAGALAMPPSSKMPDADALQIELWIQQGAK